MKKTAYPIGGHLLYKILDIYTFKHANEYVSGLLLFY